MEKKITSDDLLMAIGDLPEELVKYPTPAAARYKIIKRLSAVLCAPCQVDRLKNKKNLLIE